MLVLGLCPNLTQKGAIANKRMFSKQVGFLPVYESVEDARVEWPEAAIELYEIRVVPDEVNHNQEEVSHARPDSD